MATRRYNGHKHHSRRHQSSEQMNRRRLSKQEEIDLTLDAIDIKEEAIDSNPKCNNFNTYMSSNEPTIAPTIHVNAVEDKCDPKLVEKEKNEKTEVLNDLELGINEDSSQTMHKNNSDSRQSLQSLDQSNCLLSEDIKEKKRGKHLARAEAVRDTSISPPPLQQINDMDEKSSNTLAVISSNSQSQMGSSMNSSHKTKGKAQENSSGSLDRSSPCLSRDSSTENFSDSTGIDVQQFISETLQKNKKDRVFLLKIEQDLTQLVKDTNKTTLKFQPMTSYNRMLVHRVAALYGFEHNVDAIGTAIVVTKCKNTRIPDMKFKDYIKEDSIHEPKKLILKRDSASLEDTTNGSTQLSFDGKEKSPERQTGNLSDSSRSKSFEEREERYEKARARIFNQDSSSSTEGNDSNCQLMSDNTCSNNCGNHLLQTNSSPRSSQEEDLPLQSSTNWTTTEVRAWSSTDSDSSGRHKNDVKATQNSNELKTTHSSDSDTTPKSTTLSSSSSSCGGKSLLTPDVCTSETNACVSTKNRPTVTKASSFGGISRIVENNFNNSTQTSTHLSKSGSFNVTHNPNQTPTATNIVNPIRANIPKNNLKQENSHKSLASNNMGTPHHSEQQPQHHRYNMSAQQTSQQMSNSSHNNRQQTWHQNSQQRNNTRMASIGSAIQWPQILNQNYPQFFLQQNDSNVNQMKETQYLQSGQQILLPSVPNYGQQTVNNEPQQHMNQQPIRLIYSNQPQLQQNLSSFGNLINNSIQVPHQTMSNQMTSVSFPLQSSQSSLNFSGNQSNIQNNSNAFNPLMNHSFGAPLQVPSSVGNLGTVWIINNQPSSSPIMVCPPPANTPPSASIGSNIAPFVGMSYQQTYRPNMNSNPNLTPNLSINTVPNRVHNPLLKSQPLLATQANTHRIMPSNGNHFIHQQVPDVVDINNILCANNYINRAPIVPQVNQMRRMPVNTNQGLDVRLVGAHGSPPFLLPTPQRPYFPLSSNSVNMNHRYNANNVNQRSKNSFSKNKPQKHYTNNKNILVPNTSTTNCSNT